MRFFGKVDGRLSVFALLAVAFGGWALFELAPLATGTLQRIGPGMVPRFTAIALVVVGLVMLVRAATGVGCAPPRLPPWPLRLVLVPLFIVLILLPDIVLFFGDVPAIAAIGAALQDLALKAGPADSLALAWLRWTLAISLGVVAAGEGVLSGLVSLLAGALIGLAGTDVASGESRLTPLETLLDEVPYGVEIGVLLVMILCRVNPLPAILAYAGAMAAEEMFRRALLLSRGDPVLAVAGRPIALNVLAVIALIVLVLAWYRWPWRSAGARPDAVA